MGEEWVWAVWSQWRGDRAKLGRVARAAEGCFRGRDRAGASVRERVMWAWTAAILAVVLALSYLFLRPAWDASTGELVAVGAGILALAVVLGDVPWVRDRVLPAVEIAEQTPGRRVAARAIPLATAPVVGYLSKVVLGG